MWPAAVEGGVQPTDTFELTTPPSWTSGSFAAVLHSSTVPGDLAASPVPVTVTDWPPAIPVLGVTVMLPAADAEVTPNATPNMEKPPTSSRAPIHR
jgi:hypothetical protein